MEEAGLELLVRATVIAERKSTYDTGHGEFAFGRLNDICIWGHYPPKIPPGHRENNVQFVELGGFVCYEAPS